MTGLKEEDYEKIRDELDSCSRPLYFFHDDSDGLASFLLLYKYKREGSGVVVKAAPNLDKRFLKKVEEYQPDKIFLLDIPIVDQGFIDSCKVPIIWIDHHPPLERRNIKYYNPRKYNKDENTAASALCYGVVKQDLWIAAIGIVGDWQLSELTREFAAKYPDLLSPDITRPEKALFETRLGELIRIYESLLKGPTQKVIQSVKILTRIDDPYEVLEGRSSRARLLLKRFRSIAAEFNELFELAKKKAGKSRYLIFTYQENKMSFSGELANKLLYSYPDKIVIVAREKSGEMKCSFRARDAHLPSVIEKALVNVTGYGGGHEQACGGCIKVEDWKLFLKQFKKGVEKQMKKASK
ncbi:MAG: DHH family phosphoesterase [Nanoarchaeota archaeon]|nr:DHH family phosphoesterase [Nanoarchaeota archaeon]